MKKLNTYDSYFVVLDTGLYLYNLNSFDCSIIMSFNDTIYYNSSKNKVDLNDLKNDECSYILCMVNEYLFIFDEFNNKTFSYKVNEIDSTKNYYFNIIPYKFENNNISFFVSYNDEIAKFYFLYYNFPIKENINTPKKIVIRKYNY